VHSGSFTLQNTGNAVRECYRSALSLYLKKRYGPDVWMRYLALQWLAEIIKVKKISSPKKFIQKYEGLGTLTDVTNFAFRLLRHASRKTLFNKKFVVIKDAL
jgi:hypothetical protein